MPVCVCVYGHVIVCVGVHEYVFILKSSMKFFNYDDRSAYIHALSTEGYLSVLFTQGPSI